jgi:hypothetical protein
VGILEPVCQSTISALLELLQVTKSYSQLLAEGVPHRGGLAMLAAAEKLKKPSPALAGLAVRFRL